jgi:membrane protein YqaA with SNARE-associated domain
LNFLKHIFASYTEYIRALLIPLGPWGIFLIAFSDAAFLGIPMDPLVAYFVYRRPGLFWLYTLMGAAGSALGSLVVYYIGRKGEEVLLEKRIPKQRLQKIRRAFERHEFLALMVPSMLPPPTPFKAFVLTAGGLKMRLDHFLLAIFSGRIIRFATLSVLTIFFGPQIVTLTLNLVKQHLPWLLAATAVGLLLWLLRRRRGAAQEAEPATEEGEEPRLPA